MTGLLGPVDWQRVAIGAARIIRVAIGAATTETTSEGAIKTTVESLDASLWFLLASDDAHTPGERTGIKVEIERLRDALCHAAVESTPDSVRAFLSQRASQLESVDRDE